MESRCFFTGWLLFRSAVAIRTSSYPSDSSSRTITRSPRALGRFLPTWSARMGSSRCPRSTSTASRTVSGRPRSFIASSAARTVRPEKSTSSTSTTTLPSTPPGGIRVWCGPRVGCLRRSSRYIVMSSVPSGTSTPSTLAIRSATRRARWTPRVGMPSRTRPSGPLLRSRISWEMRVSAREMSRASRTVRPSGRAAASGAGASDVGCAGTIRSGPPSPPHRTVR